LLDTWRYVLGADGEKTGTVRRIKGRTAGEVMADLSYEARELLKEVEYADLSYSFGRRTDGSQDSETEVPKVRRVACYAVTGGNEGHYVHVDIHTPDNEQVPFILVKTFMGMDHARAISNKLADLLGA